MGLEAAIQALGGSDKPAFDASGSYGTPPKLLDNLRTTESGSDTYAVNKDTKAMGPYQFLPDTVAMLHKQGVKFNPFDEGQSRAAADYYLQDLTRQNGGDLNKAVAAYGGFKTKDPSAYVGKVTAGLDAAPAANGPLSSAIAALGGADTSVAPKAAPAPAPQAVAAPQPVPSAPAGPSVENTALAGAPLPARLAYRVAEQSGIPQAAGEVGHAVVSGIGHTILGGLMGAYNLATGGSPEEAANVVNEVKSDTYQAKGAGPQKAVELLGSNWNPMNWPAAAGKKIAEYGVDAGLLTPIEATAIEAGSNLITPAMILKGLKGLKGAVTEGMTTEGALPHGSVGASAVANPEAIKTALAGRSPELAAAVAKVKDINSEAFARHVEADSLPVKIQLTKGQATQDLPTLSNEQNMRGKNPALAQRFSEQNEGLKENLNAIREKAAPDVYGTNHVENGQSLIDAYKATDDALRTDISGKYKALEAANGGQFPIDGVAFVNAADSALAAKMKGAYVPKEIRSQMDAIRDGAPMTFENFENLRTNLAADARRAERAGDGNQAYAVSLVRDSLEALPLTGDAAALKPLADAARSAAKARFDLLKKDPAYKAAVNDTIAADDFINKFVVKGKAANVETMVNNLGKDSVAHQTMAAGVVNYLKARAGIVNEAGNFSQAGYNKAMQELSPKLLNIVGPEAAKDLTTLGNVARYTQAQPRGSFVNNSNTFVAAAAQHAANFAEGLANKVTLGVGGTAVRNTLEKNAIAKQTKNSLQTGAGISLKDIGK